VILLRVEVSCQHVDERLRHLQLFLADLSGLRHVEFLRAPDLVGVEHGFQRDRVVVDAQGAELLFLPQRHLRQCHELRVGEHAPQQRERLGADLVRLQVIRLLIEDRVDLLRWHEVGDLDGVGRVDRDVVEVLRRHDHILVRRDLVAARDIVPLDDRVVFRAVALLLDAYAVLLVEHVECDVLLLGRGVEFDRDGHHPETHGPFPHCARHVAPLREAVPTGLFQGRRDTRDVRRVGRPATVLAFSLTIAARAVGATCLTVP